MLYYSNLGRVAASYVCYAHKKSVAGHLPLSSYVNVYIKNHPKLPYPVLWCICSYAPTAPDKDLFISNRPKWAIPEKK